MPRQLIFDLPVRVSRSRGDFFVSDANRLAVARLEDTGGWPQGKLALAGPEGSGKTHFVHVWAEADGARILAPEDLGTLDVGRVTTPVALDRADGVGAEDETTLFHLHNHMAAQGLPLLLVGREAPARWTVALPDLKSRLGATDVVRIEPPDDALLAAVLVKHFADRQIDVAPSVIAYLMARMDRSFATAQKVAEALDRTSLSEGRAVTRTLARAVLDKL